MAISFLSLLKSPRVIGIIIQTINAIWVIFEYVRHNFVSVTFSINKIFVSQMIVKTLGLDGCPFFIRIPL